MKKRYVKIEHDETREQSEIKLAEMIERVKAEIAEEKAKLKECAE